MGEKPIRVKWKIKFPHEVTAQNLERWNTGWFAWAHYDNVPWWELSSTVKKWGRHGEWHGWQWAAQSYGRVTLLSFPAVPWRERSCPLFRHIRTPAHFPQPVLLLPTCCPQTLFSHHPHAVSLLCFNCLLACLVGEWTNEGIQNPLFHTWSITFKYPRGLASYFIRRWEKISSNAGILTCNYSSSTIPLGVCQFHQL